MHICTCNGYRTDLALKWTSVHRIHLYTCVYFKHIQIVSPKCDRVVVVWWVIFAFSVNLFWPRRLHRIVSRQGQSHMQDSFGCCRLSRRDIVTCTKPRNTEMELNGESLQYKHNSHRCQLTASVYSRQQCKAWGVSWINFWVRRNGDHKKRHLALQHLSALHAELLLGPRAQLTLLCTP